MHIYIMYMFLYSTYSGTNQVLLTLYSLNCFKGKFICTEMCEFYFIPWFSCDRGCQDYSSRCNTLRPEQNGCLFADDIFKCIFLKENICILIEISLKLVCYGLTDNKSTLVQVTVCRLISDKPLVDYLNQCWPGCLKLYSITWQYWVNVANQL